MAAGCKQVFLGDQSWYLAFGLLSLMKQDKKQNKRKNYSQHPGWFRLRLCNDHTYYSIHRSLRVHIWIRTWVAKSLPCVQVQRYSSITPVPDDRGSNTLNTSSIFTWLIIKEDLTAPLMVETETLNINSNPYH